MNALSHSWAMTVRHLRSLARQPWYVAFSLVQPMVYLLIFGQLFKRIVELPGFATTSYLVFITPGVVVTSALFSGGWGGIGVIEDLDRGVLDRFLVAPTSRGALIAGRLIQLAVVAVIQSAIIVAVALAIGARFEGGVVGVLVLIGSAVLLAAPFGALSSAIALLARQQESVIGVVQFVLLPLTFLSSVFMEPRLAPDWIRTAARVNPVNWSVLAGREALAANPDWALVLSRIGSLLALTVVCWWLAIRAFRGYQRSV